MLKGKLTVTVNNTLGLQNRASALTKRSLQSIKYKAKLKSSDQKIEESKILSIVEAFVIKK